ncbi:N-acetylglucosamine-6-phosphate deacetylase [Anatilimnocola floriformis]|uniref:N-acetylglucosamine-6-phosphate deacetylase n=1 Tax=Anatilimnocola floriformis TaxID=2948575 RepID=UPI0020C46D0A|nr:amidohydrolase family protein [Anatilimnocola floriformis]
MFSFVARRYDTLRPVEVLIASGRIARITPARIGDGLTGAGSLPVVAPGFVDLQINGYQGREFNDPQLTAEKVRHVALAMDASGCTSFLATCTTDSYEVLANSFAVLARTIEELPEVAARIPGFHCEGPFISSIDGPRGAHPKQHVRVPTVEEFLRLQDAACGRIKLLTISPEFDEAIPVIRAAVKQGVIIAIGHTAATSEQITAAIDAGATMSTHLGNGAHPQIRRHPNYIWDQLADDRLTASLIVDGHHLPANVVKAMIRAKGTSRCVLVSDVTSLGGMPAGRYATGLGDLEVLDNGKLVIAGQRDILAGASLLMDTCVAQVMRFAGVSLTTAIEMASTQPAALIGRHDHRLDVGCPANLVLFDEPTAETTKLVIRRTMSRGEWV